VPCRCQRKAAAGACRRRRENQPTDRSSVIMPYIAITTAKKLDPDQKKAISAELGSFISILPHKTEQGLMISFADGLTMYNKGQETDNCVYAGVHLYGTSGFAFKAELTEKLFALFTGRLGTRVENIYISFNEFSTWGTMGKLK
jgi:phenylpyruvate tautomerase PptA (4-oxalocrotonate tautomerase family)